VAAWPQFATEADLDEQTTKAITADIARFRPT
jgi:hypothetical protein